MNNEQMKAGRFLALHKARRMFRFITANLAAGNDIQLTTYTRSTVYKTKHAAMFKLSGRSVYVQRGKSWDCINSVHVRALGEVGKLIAGLICPTPTDATIT
jgi:hypothetical protein